MGDERNDNKVTRVLREVLDQAVENHEIAGANLLVTQHGSQRWYVQSGMRNIAQHQPMTRDTIFRLYSMSKPVTATAVMMLIDRGLLDMGDPVSRFLPGFAHQKVSAEDLGIVTSDIPTESLGDIARREGGESQESLRENTVPISRDVTVKDLLTMTSGLSYPDSSHAAGRGAARVFDEIDRNLLTDHPLGTLDIANRMGELPLHFQPGSHWMYGTSADVLGAIIEVVSGRRFGDFLRTELFEPLEMSDTGFFVPSGKQQRVAAVYDNPLNPMQPENALDGIGVGSGPLKAKESAEAALREMATNHLGIRYHGETDPAYQSGGAGLLSTLDDFSRFGRMLLQGGEYEGNRFLSPGSVEAMTRTALLPPQQRDYESWQTGYGYNFLMRVLERPGESSLLGVKGEYGWDGWLGTYFCNIPHDDATVVMGLQLTNSGTFSVTRKIKNVIFSALSR
ncbi:MAG: beta-lactamase family protein [Bifidobacteriaceae bacterium]|jgi:CubicO group peptidase (beta-lactamase class C family)|nr:beta-lactamase family protein [Bifidobacteriaceae bacterium]MCI1914981.1 beta-lactamase family protein [Bifidobacteriaceae bacterium]